MRDYCSPLEANTGNNSRRVGSNWGEINSTTVIGDKLAEECTAQSNAVTLQTYVSARKEMGFSSCYLSAEIFME
jgi:hypothetical protein